MLLPGLRRARVCVFVMPFCCLREGCNTVVSLHPFPCRHEIVRTRLRGACPRRCLLFRRRIGLASSVLDQRLPGALGLSGATRCCCCPVLKVRLLGAPPVQQKQKTRRRLRWGFFCKRVCAFVCVCVRFRLSMMRRTSSVFHLSLLPMSYALCIFGFQAEALRQEVRAHRRRSNHLSVCTRRRQRQCRR